MRICFMSAFVALLIALAHPALSQEPREERGPDRRGGAEEQHQPDGGLFTWLTFPPEFDAAEFLTETLMPQAKVAFVPGATFFPVEQQPNHARISFSGVSDERMVRGITAIGELLHDR